MPSSVREMLAEANAALPRLNSAEVRDMIAKENVLIVDVRDAPELASGGKLKGAVNVSRGMVEFRPIRKAHSTIRRFGKTRLS
jgi:predicted sulfurtransferase